MGRLFLKNRKQKFSSFLLEERIRLAQGLMRYAPWLRVSQVAEMVGYSPDGQYFSKAFKKSGGLLSYGVQRGTFEKVGFLQMIVRVIPFLFCGAAATIYSRKLNNSKRKGESQL